MLFAPTWARGTHSFDSYKISRYEINWVVDYYLWAQESKNQAFMQWQNIFDDLSQTFYSTWPLNAEYRFKSCYLSLNRKKVGMPDYGISFREK